MSERLGKQFVVENRPGGSAVIASIAVAKAAPAATTAKTGGEPRAEERYRPVVEAQPPDAVA